jgi:flavoprotein
MDSSITTANAERICLEVWKSMSQDHPIMDIDQKEHRLQQMGYRNIRNNCPLCEVYVDPDCFWCPIHQHAVETCAPEVLRNYGIDCEHSSPYMAWMENPCSSTAKVFYEYLLMVLDAKDENVII